MKELLNEIDVSTRKSINSAISTLTSQLNELKKNPDVSEEQYLKVEENHNKIIHEMNEQLKNLDKIKSNLKSFKL